MNRRIWRWLQNFGFTDDPFAVSEADQERIDLPFFFVDRPYLHNVMGTPAHPQPAILMASRGGGKTATREMVAYECVNGEWRRRALAVRYYDFSHSLEEVGDVGQLTAKHHVQAIARATLKALADDVPASYFDLLENDDRSLLMTYATRFADSMSRLKLGRILASPSLTLNWEDLSAREVLEVLAGLIAKLGQSPVSRYQALYVLVDRADETVAGPQAAIPLLKPLIGDMPLLETPHVAFKFFLSTDIGEQLRQSVNLRTDRVCVQTVTWDAASLREVVQQRLRYYSKNEVERLEDLCAPTIKATAMDRLIRACDASPRTLLRLCKDLIDRRATHGDTNNVLIDRDDLSDTLSDFEQRAEQERSQQRSAGTHPSCDFAPPETGLFLDDNGHVWVDGTLLAPPLSEMEYRLLKALHRQAPEIVQNETLIQTVWADSDRMDEQNLRKLVDRLRRHIEPGVSGQDSRFIQNVRGRGYWLKLA